MFCTSISNKCWEKSERIWATIFSAKDFYLYHSIFEFIRLCFLADQNLNLTLTWCRAFVQCGIAIWKQHDSGEKGMIVDSVHTKGGNETKTPFDWLFSSRHGGFVQMPLRSQEPEEPDFIIDSQIICLMRYCTNTEQNGRKIFSGYSPACQSSS